MSEILPCGEAVVYCAGAFATTYGKTAHGLVRFTRRYIVKAVIDPACAGHDAGELLDGQPVGIPVVADLATALAQTHEAAERYFVVGVATDGGRADHALRAAVREALEAGLSVHSGLHHFFAEDPELQRLAHLKGSTIYDVRRPPPRSELHSFSGSISEVASLRVALLGTDSAIGKRTTAWKLVQALEQEGICTEMIGTGQTAWMQGVRYGVVLDSLVNDFIAGEIEHAVLQAWRELRPQVMILEGQGSLMNPAYPGGYEILAAARPQMVVMQHAPARKEYDGFPGFAIHPLQRQIQAVELISNTPVVAVSVNHEGMNEAETNAACESITRELGLPAFDPVRHGVGQFVEIMKAYFGAGTHT